MSIIPQTTDFEFPDLSVSPRPPASIPFLILTRRYKRGASEDLPRLSDEATQALMAGTRRTTTVAAPPVKSHHHDWHQETVSLTPNHGPPGGTAGAVVMWRCARRGCRALREVKYVFKCPRKNQNPNAWSGEPAPGGA